MNLICYICEKEISVESKIARVISIKRIQRNGTDARIEYTGDQEELYIHLDCIQNKKAPTIPCLANNENFNQDNSRIMNEDNTVLKSSKEENTDSLVRNNILNF